MRLADDSKLILIQNNSGRNKDLSSIFSNFNNQPITFGKLVREETEREMSQNTTCSFKLSSNQKLNETNNDFFNNDLNEKTKFINRGKFEEKIRINKQIAGNKKMNVLKQIKDNDAFLCHAKKILPTSVDHLNINTIAKSFIDRVQIQESKRKGKLNKLAESCFQSKQKKEMECTFKPEISECSKHLERKLEDIAALPLRLKKTTEIRFSDPTSRSSEQLNNKKKIDTSRVIHIVDRFKEINSKSRNKSFLLSAMPLKDNKHNRNIPNCNITQLSLNIKNKSQDISKEVQLDNFRRMTPELILKNLKSKKYTNKTLDEFRTPKHK